MGKKVGILFVVGILVLVGCPLAARTFLQDSGMLVSILLLVVINPVFFIGTGMVASERIKKYWFVPLACVVIFAVSYGLMLEMKEPVYSVIYLILGYTAMGVGAAGRKLLQRRRNVEN